MATPYHRLAREHPDHEWWKLPVAGVIGTFGYLAVTVVLGIVAVLVMLIAMPQDEAAFDRWIDDLLEGTIASPWMLAFMLGSIALMLPAVILSVLATGPRPVGYLSSVEGRLRWGWLARTGVVALVLYTVMIVGSLLLGIGGEVTSPSLDDDALVYLAVVLLIVPFQATAEEYVFRGYLFQLVGSWTRWAIVPVVVSTPLFVLGHAYDFWGLVDVGIFALLASWLVIRTGGLEAAIVAHVANNLVLFVMESFNVFAITGDDYGPVDVLPTLVTSLLFALLVEAMARREQLTRTRPPLPPKPPPVVWGAVWPYPHPQAPYPYPYPPQPYPYPPQYYPLHPYPYVHGAPPPAAPVPPVPPPPAPEPPQEASHD